MYKKDDIIVYKNDICKIIDIKNINGKDYYILTPVYDDSLKNYVPFDNVCNMRKIISKNEAEKIIDVIPSVDVINVDNDKLIENEYKNLLNEMNHIGLIKIIKTTYLRNKDRIDSKRKIGEKDDMYFKKAEKMLYTELSYALNKSYDETKNYIIEKVSLEDKKGK